MITKSIQDKLLYMNANAIMFHHFHGADHSGRQGSISSTEFDELLDRYGSDRFLGADNWMEKAMAGALSEQDCCITFDDNLLCQYEIAVPVLEARGLTAFWFVCSSAFEGEVERIELYRYFRTTQFDTVNDFYRAFDEVVAGSGFGEEVSKGLDKFVPSTYLKEHTFYSDEDRQFRYVRDKILGTSRYDQIMDQMIKAARIDEQKVGRELFVTAEQVKDLSDKGHNIGLHTHTHPLIIKGMSISEQEAEYRSNHDWLSKITGKTINTMAHPCNSYDDNTFSILDELNIKVGFRAEASEMPFHRFKWPRIDHSLLLKEYDMIQTASRQ